MEGFTSHQAFRLTGCTPRQLRYWDQIGLVKPSVQETGGRPGVPRLYSFRDLVALKVVRQMLDGGMSLQRIRRAWDFLNRRAGLDKHLSEVKLVTDGVSIFKISRKRGEILDALREGQMAFFVAIDEIARNVSDNVAQFRADRDKFIRALTDARREVQAESVRAAAAGQGRGSASPGRPAASSRTRARTAGR
jgi:DNA-binding transcriptional MerR regulator